MKKMLILLLLLFPMKIFGMTYGGCSYDEIADLKKIVSNINISYSYYISDQAYFSITLTNLTDGVYFVDSFSEKEYYYSNSNNGELTISGYTTTKGTYQFYSNLDNCKGVSISSKYYTLPNYNPFYNIDACKDAKEYDMCKRWSNSNYSNHEYEYISQMVNEYVDSNQEKSNDEKEKDVEYNESTISKILSFYVNNYYYILGGVIIIIGIIIIAKKKKDKIKL